MYEFPMPQTLINDFYNNGISIIYYNPIYELYVEDLCHELIRQQKFANNLLIDEDFSDFKSCLSFLSSLKNSLVIMTQSNFWINIASKNEYRDPHSMYMQKDYRDFFRKVNEITSNNNISFIIKSDKDINFGSNTLLFTCNYAVNLTQDYFHVRKNRYSSNNSQAYPLTEVEKLLKNRMRVKKLNRIILIQCNDTPYQ